MANLYKVNAGDVPMPTDVNQYADALQGNSDVGALSFADYLSSPSSAPTAAVASGSALGIGTYKYGFTFVTGYKKSNGTLIINGETLLSPVATVNTTSGNQAVNLTNIATSSAPYVVARRIYRTKVGGSTYYLLAQINDNVTTTYTDTTADNALSTQVAPTTNTTGTGFSKLNIVNASQPNVSLTNIQQSSAGDLLISNNQKAIVNESASATFLTGNAYFDGTNWYRYSSVLPAAALAVQQGQDPQFWAIGTGTGPITWNKFNIFHEGNFTTRTHVLAYMWQGGTVQNLVANSWNRVKFDTKVYDYLNEFDTTNWWFVPANAGIYFVAFGVRIINVSSTYNIMLGTNQIGNPNNYYNLYEDHPNAGTVQYTGAQVLYLPAGQKLECRVWLDSASGPQIDVGQSDTWITISRIA